MNTKPSFYLILALFVAGFTGCESPGPLTRAVALSQLKTFDVVAKSVADSSVSRSPAPDDVLMQTARDEALAKGYQLQAASPDFVISVGWAWTEKMVQTTPPGPPPDIAVSQVMLSIIVKSSATGEVLWKNPGGQGPVDAKGMTVEDARVMVRKAMRDFPPSVSSAG